VGCPPKYPTIKTVCQEFINLWIEINRAALLLEVDIKKSFMCPSYTGILRVENLNYAQLLISLPVNQGLGTEDWGATVQRCNGDGELQRTIDH
jgi:hypothetical protein